MNQINLNRLRRLLLFCSVLLGTSMITGCTTPEDTSQEDQVLDLSVTTSLEAGEQYFNSLLPYHTNETRGLLASRIGRVDGNHLELGMLDIAQQTFDREKVYFQEGNMLKREQVVRWLERNSAENPEGLNPAKNPKVEKQEPLFLLHLLEHDYVQRDGTLAGMVIGLSIAPPAKVKDAQERAHLLQQQLEKGKGIAQEVTLRIRNQGIDVPIIIALYYTQPAQSFLPGNFVAVGKVKAKEEKISEWEDLGEEYLIFPSGELATKYEDLQDQFNTISDNAQDFFPNYVSLVGTGRFVNKQLVELTVEANASFESKTEVIQLTQYLGEQLKDTLPKSVHINLYVSSVNKPQALYVRPIEGKDYMHIYRN